jgi:hypothetical protein
MMKKIFSVCLMLLFLTENLLSCEVERATACMQLGSFEKCLASSNCSQEDYFKAFCPTFNYPDCLDQSSEDKCQKKQDECQNYLADHPSSDKPEIDRSNFEGYLGFIDTGKRIKMNLSGLEFSDFSPFSKKIGEPPLNCGGATSAPVNNTAPAKAGPDHLNAFLNMADNFGNGVKRYVLGSYQAARTDCSGFLMQAMKKAGMRVMGSQFDLAPNYPVLFKKCDPKNLKPGDMLLLNYPGRQPDHWIMVTSAGKWPSGDIDMMDVSSDYVNGSPFYKGKLSRRRNLQNRAVFSCMRHRDLDK